MSGASWVARGRHRSSRADLHSHRSQTRFASLKPGVVVSRLSAMAMGRRGIHSHRPLSGTGVRRRPAPETLWVPPSSQRARQSDATKRGRHKRRMASLLSAALVLAGADLVVVAGSAGAAATPVGSLAFKAAAGTTTLAVSPQHAGDLLTLVVKVESSTITVASVTGGGVSSWARAEGPYTGYAGHDLEIWTGPVNTAGASSITVGFSGSVSTVYTALASQEFSASGSSLVWSVDNGAGISNASSTTATFPKLTPSGTGELYFGYAAVANTASAGSTTGFTYATTSDGDVSAYDTSVSAAVQPTSSQSPAGVSGAVGVLISAVSTSPSAPTVTAVAPNSGPTTGGTSVTITGTNFTGVTGVKFGDRRRRPLHRQLRNLHHRAGSGRLGRHGGCHRHRLGRDLVDNQCGRSTATR